jgi:hypothetical protein
LHQRQPLLLLLPCRGPYLLLLLLPLQPCLLLLLLPLCLQQHLLLRKLLQPLLQ